MNKLENALSSLGISAETFDDWKADLQAEKIVTENGLLPVTDPIDEDDENQIDMDAISPHMRELYE